MENIKIQITLPVDTLDLLKKDAASFGFFKKNGKAINLNDFLNKIFENYLKFYLTNRDKIGKEIAERFNNTLRNVNKKIKEKSETPDAFEIPDMQEDYKNELIHEMVLFFERKYLLEDVKKKETKSYTLLIQKNNLPLYKENKEIIESNSSEFFRRLFLSYTSLPFDQRELIIFKKVANDLLNAINSQRLVRITIDQKSLDVVPIILAPTEIDPYTYLICGTSKKRNVGKLYVCTAYRLANIKFVKILDKDTQISKQDIEALKKRAMAKLFFVGNEKQIVKIHFSPRGINMLKELYNVTPLILSEDIGNSIYTFYCDIYECNQFLTYFKEDAIIIDPSYMAIGVQMHHCFSRDINNKDYKYWTNTFNMTQQKEIKKGFINNE